MWYPEDYDFDPLPYTPKQWLFYCGNVFTGQTNLSYKHNRMGYDSEGELSELQQRSPITYKHQEFWADDDNSLRIKYKSNWHLLHKVSVWSPDKPYVTILPNFSNGIKYDRDSNNYPSSAPYAYNEINLDETILHEYSSAWEYFMDYYDPDDVIGNVSACTSEQTGDYIKYRQTWKLILNWRDSPSATSTGDLRVKVYQCTGISQIDNSFDTFFGNATMTQNIKNRILNNPYLPYSSCYGPLGNASRRTYLIIFEYQSTDDGAAALVSTMPTGYRSCFNVIMSCPNTGTVRFNSTYAYRVAGAIRSGFPDWNVIANLCKQHFFVPDGNASWIWNQAFCFPTLTFNSTMNIVCISDRVHERGYVDGADSPDYPRWRWERRTTYANQNPSAIIGLNGKVLGIGSKSGNGGYFFSGDFQGGVDTHTFSQAVVYRISDGEILTWIGASNLKWPFTKEKINYVWTRDDWEADPNKRINYYSACIMDYYEDYSSSGGIDQIYNSTGAHDWRTDFLLQSYIGENPAVSFQIDHKVSLRIINPPIFEVTLNTMLAPQIIAY